MEEKRFSVTIMEKEISVIACNTGNGLNVIIAGGDSPHIGSVSVKAIGENTFTKEFPTHKDSIISDKWAETLSCRYNTTVVVSAGIHYDGIDREGIRTILNALDEILEEI